jgi:coenzyme F420-reducing hydrogenase beta subunit
VGDNLKVLLYGEFGKQKESVERVFGGRAELFEYGAPLNAFVNSRFKSMAADADVAIYGGEPRYKPYVAAAKKAGCKLALWGCEAGWIYRNGTTLPLFDIIFAKDKEALAALKHTGLENVVLLPKTADKPVDSGQTAVDSGQLTVDSENATPEVLPASPEKTPKGGRGNSKQLINLKNLPKLKPLDETEHEQASTTDSQVSTLNYQLSTANCLHAYGVVNQNENVRASSAAGGVFTLLCEEVTGKGGVVFGAVYDKEFNTVHTKAERMPECEPMRGVKYVISDTTGIYDKAVSSLSQGKRVLFTGTSCQIATLYTALSKGGTSFGREHPLLITADVVCGGAADPKVFDAYLKYVEEKNGSPVTAVDFSNKPMGVSKASVRIGSESGTYDVPISRDPFMRAYRAGLCLREGCHKCPHRKEKRESDLTLGFFAEGRKHIPELCDDKGASLVLAHSQKGREMMESIANRSIVREIPPDALSDYNPAIITVPEKHKNRERFYRDLSAMRFDKAVVKSIGPAVLDILPLWGKKS